MQFLNPFLLWGGALIAAPIIIHLINKQNYRKVEWAAMRFLKEAIVRTQKRLRLEQLLLLLLRILVILLLVLSLSQPFVTSVMGIKLEEDSFYAIMAIDNSYSMAYNTGSGSLFDKARELAASRIDRMRQGRDRVSIVLMSEHPSVPLGEASELLEKAKARLKDKDDKEIRVSDHAGNIGKSLLTVKAMIDQSPLRSIRVYIFTDNQQRAWRDTKGQMDENLVRLMKQISEKAKITLVDVGLKESTDYANVAVKNMKTSLPILAKDIPFQFSAEVMNSSPTPARVGVTLFVDGDKQMTKPVELGPKELKRVEFHYVFRTGGPHHARVDLDADALLKDNSRSIALDVLDALDVLCIDGNPADKPSKGETIFLTTALNPRLTSNGGSNTIIRPDVKTELDLLAVDTSRYDGIVLANVSSLPDEFVTRSLETFVRNGGGLIVFLGNRVDPAQYNRVLYKGGKGLLPLRIEGAAAGDPDQKNRVKMKLADSDHSLTQSLKNSNIPRSPFFVVFEYFNTVQGPEDKGTQVVARYNTSDAPPAIATKKFGKGHVVLVTTSAGQRWNLLGIDPQWFVPMVQDMVRYVTAGLTEQVNGETGDEFTRTIAQELYGKELYLKSPLGDRVPQTPLPREGGQLQVSVKDTLDAGIYVLEQGMSGGAAKKGQAQPFTVLSYFSANIDATESDLDRFSKGEVTGLFPGVTFEYFDGSGSIEDARKKSEGKDLWRYFLWALFAATFVEMFLAQKFGTFKA